MNLYFFSARMGEDSKASVCVDCCNREACLLVLVITFTASTNWNPPLLSSSVRHRSKPALLSPAGSQPSSQTQQRFWCVTGSAELCVFFFSEEVISFYIKEKLLHVQLSLHYWGFLHESFRNIPEFILFFFLDEGQLFSSEYVFLLEDD